MLNSRCFDNDSLLINQFIHDCSLSIAAFSAFIRLCSLSMLRSWLIPITLPVIPQDLT